MMGNRERPSEEGACFSVLALAVAKKEGVGSGIAVINVARLPSGAAGDLCAAVDACAGGDDKIFRDHVPADIDGRVTVAVNSPVLQFHSTGHLAMSAYSHVLDEPHVHDHAVVLDGPPVGRVFIAIIVDDGFHLFD